MVQYQSVRRVVNFPKRFGKLTVTQRCEDKTKINICQPKKSIIFNFFKKYDKAGLNLSNSIPINLEAFRIIVHNLSNNIFLLNYSFLQKCL